MPTENTGYSEALEDFFHDVVLTGCGVVVASKLLRWTRRIRVTPTLWGLVNEVCEKVLKETGQEGWELFVGEGADTYTFAIWDRGVRDPEADGWWLSVARLAEGKKGRKIARGEPAAA